ncbi:hypothetical protein KFL_011220030 [Klebsormidium nitens]|uniref:Retrovirus-related Pol polyprotein from transposon TNT 1-94-like beta-barrel domain-containing protein n=1 Tax=Klebsormidium nitens TaxID=105231 RepID=A0A1Y1IPY0_KLENI|nr:hypothetical protein KFL_011220030 [Klebsormidium nitens]|eukprot:GAQ92754.1 hypothetical protein KFL_011220030 [Klebsormidium nitens]
MAGIDKIVIPQLGGENWSVWRAKFRALLEYKGLYVVIEQPDPVEGRKASGQAKALMNLHTQDAYVKLFIGESTAAKAWKKLEENFEKTSNARVVQLRKKLTSLTLTREKSIAEYVGEFREIQVDLETAGQTVSEVELAIHALNGLPKEYATLVEVLELSEEELTLDTIQLMQKEQKLKLEEKLGTPEKENSMGNAFVANRERPRGGAKGGGEDRPDRKEFAGVAFMAWRKEARLPADVWLVDSGSTQHITGDKRQFASYERLARTETIEGLGGEALTAVGIGQVVLECETPNGTGKTERRFGKVAPKPEMRVEKKQAEVRPVKVIEVDLESGDESDNGVKETQSVDVSVGKMETPTEKKTEKHCATEAVGAGAEGVEATTAERVGARINRKDKVESEKMMSPEMDGKRYPERTRVPPGEDRKGETGWVTPKAKKRAGRKG